jgi:Leucine-rich repeat (LRR) protein
MNKNILIKNKIKDFYKKKYVSNNVNNACKENNKIKNIIITYVPLLKNDIIYKIVNRLASRCTFYINIKDYNLTHNELIGCSHEELKEHLENKFQEVMNFDNYGEWD